MERHIVPFRQADLIISHNRGVTASLQAYGVAVNASSRSPIPSHGRAGGPEHRDHPEAQASRKRDRAGHVGFMHKHKGIEKPYTR
jgi:hypothetical protein